MRSRLSFAASAELARNLPATSLSQDPVAPCSRIPGSWEIPELPSGTAAVTTEPTVLSLDLPSMRRNGEITVPYHHGSAETPGKNSFLGMEPVLRFIPHHRLWTIDDPGRHFLAPLRR